MLGSFRPLIWFWATILVVSAAGATTLQLLGPPASRSNAGPLEPTTEAPSVAAVSKPPLGEHPASEASPDRSPSPAIADDPKPPPQPQIAEPVPPTTASAPHPAEPPANDAPPATGPAPLPATADTSAPSPSPQGSTPAPAAPSTQTAPPRVPPPVAAAPVPALPVPAAPASIPAKPKVRPGPRKAVVDSGAAVLDAKPPAATVNDQPATNYVGTYVTGANGVREFRPGP